MHKHYHLEVQANPKEIAQKTMLFLASMGETGLSHDIFFKFSVRPFEVVEVKWPQMVKFWGCDLEIWQSFLNFWLLISKRLGRPLYDKWFKSSNLFSHLEDDTLVISVTQKIEMPSLFLCPCPFIQILSR